MPRYADYVTESGEHRLFNIPESTNKPKNPQQILDDRASAASLESEQSPEAIQWAASISPQNYYARLTSFTSVLERFDDLEPKLRQAIVVAVVENAVSLAARTLPASLVDLIEEKSEIPLDDIGFDSPPDTIMATAVARGWDVTQQESLFDAAWLMFDQLSGLAAKQQQAALEQARQSGGTFNKALRESVTHQLIVSGHYSRDLD